MRIYYSGFYDFIPYFSSELEKRGIKEVCILSSFGFKKDTNKFIESIKAYKAGKEIENGNKS